MLKIEESAKLAVLVALVVTAAAPAARAQDAGAGKEIRAHRISGGRFTLGIGAGAAPDTPWSREHHERGIPIMPVLADRHAKGLFGDKPLGKIVLKGQRKDFWDKDGAIPEWRVQELLKEHKLGYWQVQVRFYGDEAVNKAKAEVVKRAFKKNLDAAPHEDGQRTCP